jgi:hypothetical protein
MMDLNYLLINNSNQLLGFDTVLKAQEYLDANTHEFEHKKVFHPCLFEDLYSGVLAGCAMAVMFKNKKFKLRAVGSVDWIIEDHSNTDLYFQNKKTIDK